jgi:hypothetical protein
VHWLVVGVIPWFFTLRFSRFIIDIRRCAGIWPKQCLLLGDCQRPFPFFWMTDSHDGIA